MCLSVITFLWIFSSSSLSVLFLPRTSIFLLFLILSPRQNFPSQDMFLPFLLQICFSLSFSNFLLLCKTRKLKRLPKLRAGRGGEEFGQFGQCPKEKVFFSGRSSLMIYKESKGFNVNLKCLNFSFEFFWAATSSKVFQPRLNPSRHHCTIAQAAQLALTFRILQPNKVLHWLGVFKAAFNWGLPVFIVEFDVTYYFYTVPRKRTANIFCKNITEQECFNVIQHFQFKYRMRTLFSSVCL